MSAERHAAPPKTWEGLKVIHPHAAGLDIGSAEIWAAVPPASAAKPVRPFGTTTPDLQALADWLKASGVDTVAMEATGVYWVPAYEVLEARGFQVFVVNARHFKNAPGRKSDIQDCQWLQSCTAWACSAAPSVPRPRSWPCGPTCATVRS